MDSTLRERRRRECCGCYTTIPTVFHDDDSLSVNHEGIAAHVRFLIDNGIKGDYGILLAGGAAGDFMTMSFEERVAVAKTAVEAAQGEVPVAMGAQTTSTKELVALATEAQRLGVDYMQVRYLEICLEMF
eukprot:SAG31_NODE_6843_length_1865_cov_3.099887_2_plen_130_part_00